MKLTESQLADIVKKAALKVLNENAETSQKEEVMAINEEDIKNMVAESLKQILGKAKAGYNKFMAGAPLTDMGDDASIEEVAEHCGWSLEREQNGCYLFIQENGAFGDMTYIDEPEDFIDELKKRFGDVKLIHKQCKKYDYDSHQWAIIVKIGGEKEEINEHYEDDEDYGYDDADIHMAMAMYCRDTKKIYPYSHYDLDRTSEKRALSVVGDGHIFTVGLEEAGHRYEDTSFDYEIGMDSGIHHEGYYTPTGARVVPDEVEYWGYYQGGKWIKDMDYEDETMAELTPEELKYIDKMVNEDIESFDEANV